MKKNHSIKTSTEMRGKVESVRKEHWKSYCKHAKFVQLAREKHAWWERWNTWKREHLEIFLSAIFEIKNTLDGTNSIWDTAKEKMNKFAGIIM